MFHTKAHLSILWRVVIEQGYQMPCQLPVCGVVDLVQHQVDEVKPGHQARGQLDIVNDADAWVVAAAHWVGACQDTSPGVQGSNDAGLGHRHCLLLHHLMQLHKYTIVSQVLTQNSGTMKLMPMCISNYNTNESDQQLVIWSAGADCCTCNAPHSEAHWACCRSAMKVCAHHAASIVRHLVKLINAAHPLIAQYQGSAFQHHLPCLWILQPVSTHTLSNQA